MYTQICEELDLLKNSQKAEKSTRFFKTGPGEYGHGDIFIGIDVPTLRNIIKKYAKTILYQDIQKFIQSPIHEYRYIGFGFLRYKYEKKYDSQDKIFHFALQNISFLNNWDLVDSFVPYVVGDFLISQPKDILYTFAVSENIWERRIAVLSCFAFIKQSHFQDILNISNILLNDQHDLIQKAIGWMLREAGKRDKNVLIDFLEQNAHIMPRTMLRYAIEKLNNSEKLYFMSQKAQKRNS